MPWSDLLRQFDKRMAAASEGLREGLHWGEIINSGGSPAPLLSLHTSHPSDQASPTLVQSVFLYRLSRTSM